MNEMPGDKTPGNETLVNVAHELAEQAARQPETPAVVMPRGRERAGQRRYEIWSFQQLEEDSNRIASGLLAAGIPHFSKLVLMVRPSPDFISLVFALFKAGMVSVLIDPGMGRRNLASCLSQVEPDGFVAIPLAQAVRSVYRHRFPNARHNVTVGRRYFWGGKTLRQIRQLGQAAPFIVDSRQHDPAAVIFTTGSTGIPKGVQYSHGNFAWQAREIAQQYAIQPAERDLPGFPLFGLFNAVMGVTTVIPEMDFTRPADVDGAALVEIANDWKISQAFGSPALWHTVGRHFEATGESIPTLRRVLSAGAPVPLHVMKRVLRSVHPEAEMHTPYGATEALPVASISAAEVDSETDEQTCEGAGVCVGRRFPHIRWRIIEIHDGPLENVAESRGVPPGTIGEIMVQGPVVTSKYVTQPQANALHKVQDGDTFWHRMGDVGYLDDQDRFWFCGRKAHRVITSEGTLFPVCCEAIFNQHPAIYRSALVGVPTGESSTEQLPVLIAEPYPGRPVRDESEGRGNSDKDEPLSDKQLVQELLEMAQQNELTRTIHHVLLHPALPVDIRHNAKIFREKLGPWAAMKLKRTQR